LGVGVAGGKRIEIAYAPLDHVNIDARIVVVGLTPGRQQMRTALRLAANRPRASALRRRSSPNRSLTRAERALADIEQLESAFDAVNAARSSPLNRGWPARLQLPRRDAVGAQHGWRRRPACQRRGDAAVVSHARRLVPRLLADSTVTPRCRLRFAGRRDDQHPASQECRWKSVS
jgi:hypothetical protein